MVRILYNESIDFFNTILEEERIKPYLKKLKESHDETYSHSLRVSLLSVDLGKENELNRTNLMYLAYSGLLHDIGKMRISQRILTKDSKLDTEETKLMKGHPRLGFLELKDPEFQTVRQIVVAHHEYKTDPYPRSHNDRRSQVRVEDRRKDNDNIDKLTQILAVSDIYDALSSKRAYKKPLGFEEINRIIRKQFIGDVKYIDQILARHN